MRLVGCHEDCTRLAWVVDVRMDLRLRPHCYRFMHTHQTKMNQSMESKRRFCVRSMFMKGAGGNVWHCLDYFS